MKQEDKEKATLSGLQLVGLMDPRGPRICLHQAGVVAHAAAAVVAGNGARSSWYKYEGCI